MQRVINFLFYKMEGVSYYGDNQKFFLMEYVNCFIFSVDEGYYIVFIINNYYYVEISKVFVGYSIILIV